MTPHRRGDPDHNLHERPGKPLKATIHSRRVAQDGNPCLAWNAGIAVAREDAKEIMFVKKPTNWHKRIDGTIAAIIAPQRLMNLGALVEPSPCETGKPFMVKDQTWL